MKYMIIPMMLIVSSVCAYEKSQSIPNCKCHDHTNYESLQQCDEVYTLPDEDKKAVEEINSWHIKGDKLVSE